MMKSVARVSAWMAFAALLCCAPCALGQGTVGKSVPNAGFSLLNHAPASFLVLAIVPPYIDGHGSNYGGNNGGGGGSCGNPGGGPTGWQNGGWNGWGNGGGNGGGGGCSTSVPEGGSTWMYLLMAGFCCAGALLFGSKRQDASASAN
jgi:hypothetical protein